MVIIKLVVEVVLVVLMVHLVIVLQMVEWVDYMVVEQEHILLMLINLLEVLTVRFV